MTLTRNALLLIACVGWERFVRLQIKKMELTTRAKLLFPYLNIPLDERLRKSEAIDLRGNHTVEDMGNGYIQIKPIDPSKKY